jgi:hypothetical protein
VRSESCGRGVSSASDANEVRSGAVRLDLMHRTIGFLVVYRGIARIDNETPHPGGAAACLA